MTRAAMGQVISGEDALDSADGRQWPDCLLAQDLGDGLSTIREAPIIEMEPFHYNDLLDFLKGIEAHRFLFDSRLLAAGIEGVYFHDHVSPSLLSKMELLRTWCLRKFSSMVWVPWTAALMMAWSASWLMTLGRPLAR